MHAPSFAPARLRWHILLTWVALLAFPDSGTAAAPALPPDADPLIQHLDSGVKPGDDFYAYANGGWMKAHPIPPTEYGWGIGDLVEEEIYAQLRGICENAAAAGAARGSIEQKVGDFWTAAMDSAAIEARGAAPLRPLLDRVARVQSRADLLEVIAWMHTIGVRPVYGIGVSQDDKNSAIYAVFLRQGGLGLPDRDYYFSDAADTEEIRRAYLAHVAAMFRLLGEDEASSRLAAGAVLEIETALAGASRTLEQLRDPWANYHKMPLARLRELTPAIDWGGQLRLMGFSDVDSIVVGQPEFLSRADSVLQAISLESWRSYLRWNLVNNFADHLSRAFDRQDFEFYGTRLRGTPEPRPRWKRVIDTEEGSIGELLGQAWVKAHCRPEVRARYERLTEDIFAAYAERIRRLDWMSDSTKEKALAKLARVGKKVGYPDRWRDYATLEVDRDSYVENQLRVNEWWFRYRIGKLGQPVDRTEWGMTPQTYNAYYDGSNVEICLPAAAFIVPGAPDSLLDDALLYSYAGASTIGHEITHGFDDEGRQYDADGNMRPWWTPADSARFAERTRLLVAQFDAYVLGGRHVRGLATLGENIADLGGVVIAYDAFRRTNQYREGRVINGLTPDQRFFLGYALAWMGSLRPEAIARQIMTNVHAPQMLRVNGPLSNLPEFYAAFGVQPGDAMWRAEPQRVRIW